MKTVRCHSKPVGAPASRPLRGALWGWVLTLAFLGSAPWPAWAEVYGELEISRDLGGEGNTLRGYAEYSVVVRNLSPVDTYRVGIAMPGRSYGGGHHIRSLSRTVQVEPNSTARIRLFQPPLTMNGDGTARVIINGREQRQFLTGFNFTHGTPDYRSGFYPGTGTTGPRTLFVSPSINRFELEQSMTRWSPQDTSGGFTRTPNPKQVQLIPADRSIEGWSDQWLGYSRFDGVVVSSADMGRAPAEVAEALSRYVQTGGCLIVVGDWEAPASWPRRAVEAAGIVEAYTGFGVVLRVVETQSPQWTEATWDQLYQTMSHSAQPFQRTLGVDDANQAFPVIDTMDVPVRGLFFLMLLFTLLIGPVNLFVLSRKERRLWMLWTVPLISLFFCGIVFAYNLLAEGWQSKGRIQGITLLDHATKRATTLGWASYYSPLTLGGGLRFDFDTELTPQVQTSHYGDGGEARAVDWTHGQHLTRGWVTARIPTVFMVRKSTLERRRVDVLPGAEGGYTATNGLGVTLQTFFYCDAQGRVYHANDVAAGATVKLEESGRRVSDEVEPIRWRTAYLSSDWYNIHKTRDPRTMLRGGDYAATVLSNPFIEDGIEGLEKRSEPSVVYGQLEGAP